MIVENIERQIFVAISNNLNDLVIFYINNNKDINLEYDYNSFFVETITNCNIKLFKFLLKKGVPPACEDQIGLNLAASYGYLDILKELVKFDSIEPSKYNNQAIYEAFDSGNLEVCDFLYKFDSVINSLENDHPDIHEHYVRVNTAKKLKDF
jgi:hypothetical protein